MTGTPQSSSIVSRIDTDDSLRVSAYEYTAAGIVTGLVLLGAAVFFMFVLWISSRVFVKQITVTPELVELAGGGTGSGDAADLSDTNEEIPQQTEPALEQTLELINQFIADNSANYDANPLDEASGGRGSQGVGGGPPGAGQGQIPRWERWEVQFNSSSLAEYKKQLDFFKIELAAFGGGAAKIQYASKFSVGRPVRREAVDDTRIYLIWRDGPFANFDQQLLRQAGISTKDRIVVQFLPPEFENKLALLEDAELKARNLSLKRVKKTTFRIQREGAAYGVAVAKLVER